MSRSIRDAVLPSEPEPEPCPSLQAAVQPSEKMTFTVHTAKAYVKLPSLGLRGHGADHNMATALGSPQSRRASRRSVQA